VCEVKCFVGYGLSRHAQGSICFHLCLCVALKLHRAGMQGFLAAQLIRFQAAPCSVRDSSNTHTRAHTHTPNTHTVAHAPTHCWLFVWWPEDIGRNLHAPDSMRLGWPDCTHWNMKGTSSGHWVAPGASSSASSAPSSATVSHTCVCMCACVCVCVHVFACVYMWLGVGVGEGVGMGG
jgi:hypothetical protein